ncbi:MAG TPA: ADYC domain-containing protein, partial [Candidatus Nanopelagicales bacterium]|nr:ADYC domain-containing protein [Candidatus Nanopelagicales bacterium]
WRYRLEILWPPAGSSAQSWTSRYTSGYAVAVEGVWNDRNGEHRSSDEVITLTGDDTAVGKCYQHFRYRPWDTGDPASPRPMPELHDACVRMVRADYCGDGASATEEGTEVDVWDTANVNTKAPDRPGLLFEAAWTSKGAICLDHLRHPGRKPPPPCASALPACRSPEEAKALARQQRLGGVLLFNASYKGSP